MGSATKRKQNDQPLIRRPIHTRIDPTKEGNGNPSVDIADVAANMCPFKFQVEVTRSGIIMKGARLELIPEGDLYAYYISGHRISALSKKRSEMITNCQSIGIRYKGEIVEEKEKTYARFTRVA
ncbi:hypothetical protein LJ707_16225 [Mucilaginibacter sp. UR6-1]|uniref:hypothetical protein n=1 Tax=Mucilaginibacter sp. UR6-1 TaxID=1435643 RepID=UPI001E6165BD|nr:hypothetical protein [Mucilaginibacter sp. UR6-1]MCC8410490.1 hypothetical protein [Mucilaginibacter sp. UR6-1]